MGPGAVGRARRAAIACSIGWLMAAGGAFAGAREEKPETHDPTMEEEATMTRSASGLFDVEVTPIADGAEAGGFPRHRIAKRFHGDLEGESEGVMMSIDATEEGSGAYVALERVTATLAGRQGSFSLVHHGTMRRGGDFRLTVEVVPDSGAGELTGLAGTMEIEIAAGEHRYVLHYTLPEAG